MKVVATRERYVESVYCMKVKPSIPWRAIEIFEEQPSLAKLDTSSSGMYPPAESMSFARTLWWRLRSHFSVSLEIPFKRWLFFVQISHEKLDTALLNDESVYRKALLGSPEDCFGGSSKTLINTWTIWLLERFISWAQGIPCPFEFHQHFWQTFRLLAALAKLQKCRRLVKTIE